MNHHGRNGAHAVPGQTQGIPESVFMKLIRDLQMDTDREEALRVLSRHRDSIPDLARTLWQSGGVVAALIHEVIRIYPQLVAPSQLTAGASGRVCSALALMQPLVSDEVTRPLVFQAGLPLLLYPFLNVRHPAAPCEHLRLTSLGVIGALVKSKDPDAVGYLLRSEVIPLCLRNMESGSELCKMVATFILHKILEDDRGLSYVCQTGERFYAVASVLSKILDHLVEHPSPRLLKQVLECYVRFMDDARAKSVLQQCPPQNLESKSLKDSLGDDKKAKFSFFQLTVALSYVGEKTQA